MSGDRPWSVAADGLILSVRITPKGGCDAIDGVARLADGIPVLKVRVRTAPHDGAANAALHALLAKALRVAPSHVCLIAGSGARLKSIKIEGDGRVLAAMLEELTVSKPLGPQR